MPAARNPQIKQYTAIVLMLFTASIHAQRIFDVPPGTIKINDTLFIDKAPIDNIMYLEFIDNVQKLWTYTLSDSLKYLELENMDPTLLLHSLDENQNKELFNRVTIARDVALPEDVSLYDYFNHPQYSHHPVIGISKDLAQLYCQWRTDMVNLKWSSQIKNGDPKYHKIKYRLPTTEEYELAKAYFSGNKKLLIMQRVSPLKMDFQKVLEEDRFVLLEVPEFTSTDQYFINSATTSGDANPQADNYVFFRCICEVQK